MARRIESLLLDGPAGKLEALLEEPEDQAPREAVLICHPHPKHGGTMHNKVVYRIARGVRRAGGVALRFNYRGVNLSEGKYDEGVGEAEDTRTVLAFLRSRYPDLPFSLAGFSFGSRIVLNLGCETAGTTRIIAAGFPAKLPGSSELGRCQVPRVFLQSTNDQYGPRAETEAYFATLEEPKQLVWIEAEDHFFAGGLDALESAVREIFEQPAA